MSWDVMVHRFPKSVEKIEDVPDDFRPPIIGDRLEIVSRLQDLFPKIKCLDASWLVLDESDFSIEVSVGKKDECDGFFLHVRGSDRSVNAVCKIASHFEMRAFDLTSGRFLDNMIDPAVGLRQWRAYQKRKSNEEPDTC